MQWINGNITAIIQFTVALVYTKMQSKEHLKDILGSRHIGNTPTLRPLHEFPMNSGYSIHTYCTCLCVLRICMCNDYLMNHRKQNNQESLGWMECVSTLGSNGTYIFCVWNYNGQNLRAKIQQLGLCATYSQANSALFLSSASFICVFAISPSIASFALPPICLLFSLGL